MEAARFTKVSFRRLRRLDRRSGAGHGARRRSPSGHVDHRAQRFSETIGGGQAVMRDFAAGVNYGASDPRKDGAACRSCHYQEVTVTVSSNIHSRQAA